MNLPRTLEPEVMDDSKEAMDYDDMDHDQVNQQFVADLLACDPIGNDILDLGTGTALIPIALCEARESIRVMAADMSTAMLDLAVYRIETANMRDRVQLHHGDAKSLRMNDNYFDCVMSNSLIHHVPEPESAFAEAWRVLRTGGLLFVRDLCRPESETEVESLVEEVCSEESGSAKQLFRQSLHAALTVQEVQSFVAPLGIEQQCVTETSNRHWTLVARKT